jgi:hypothetical protein
MDMLCLGAAPSLKHTAMNSSRDSIAGLQAIGHVWTDLFYDAGVVTAHDGAFGGEEIDVLPVGGVEGYGFGSDEDVVVAEFGDGRVEDQLGFAWALDLNGFLS